MDQPQQPPITEPPKKDTSWKNVLASFMARHRHIRAKRDEVVHVHRDGDTGGGGSGGGDGDGWWKLIKVAVVVLMGYLVVSWVIAVVQAIVNAVLAFLSVAIPIAAVILAVVGMVWFFSNR